MYKLLYTNKFRKDVKILQKNKPHKLAGNYTGYWEAHLKPDWLIIWKTYPDDQEVWLTRSGTHSDLF